MRMLLPLFLIGLTCACWMFLDSHGDEVTSFYPACIETCRGLLDDVSNMLLGPPDIQRS